MSNLSVPDHLFADATKIDSTELIPLSLYVPDKALLWRLPGVVSAVASSHSSSHGGHKGHHRGGKSKETSISYSVMGGRTPGIARHISGMQKITIQATQQDPDFMNSSTTVTTYNGLYFTLAANVPNYAAYTAIFDEYKIDEIEAWITPPALATAASTVHGEYSTAIDYDDANTPSSYSTVSDKQNSLTTVIEQSHYHKWKPKFAVGTYSGTFVSFGSDSGWLDCASPNVQHYGLKTAITQTANGIEFVQAVFRLTVSFRGPGIS